MSKTKAKQWIYAFVTLVAVFFLSSFLVFCLPVFSQATGFKGINIEIKDRAGKKVGFYKESHALLVGVSNYTAGWPKLASVPHEIHQMEVAFKQNGFNEEAVKAITKVKWEAASQKNNSVEAWVAVPVQFIFSGGSKMLINFYAFLVVVDACVFK